MCKSETHWVYDYFLAGCSDFLESPGCLAISRKSLHPAKKLLGGVEQVDPNAGDNRH